MREWVRSSYHDERAKTEKLKAIIRLMLDATDYTAGACRPNEAVGAVLPKEIIAKARAAVDESESDL